MEAKCSFSGIVGGSCTYERRDRAKNTEVIPLLQCNREIAGHKSRHKSTWKIANVETGLELILDRAAIFTFPENIAQSLSPPQRFKSLLYQSAVRSVPQAQSRMDRSGGEPLPDVCRFLVHPCRFLVHRWISRLWLNLTA